MYMGHQRFLKTSHRFRKHKITFNGIRENGTAPEPLTGDLVFNQVQDVHVVLGKFDKGDTESSVWKKRSIFWSLPYWRDLDVRHCIDVMHVEKNVCDSLLGTLLDING